MKRPAHSKKSLARRVRAGMLGAICLVAVIAIVVSVGVLGGKASSPAPSLSGTSEQTTPASNPDEFIATTNGSVVSEQEDSPAQATSVELIPTAPRITVENPTFPDTSTLVTVEDEDLPPHQQSVALVMLPEGTTREQLQEMLSDAPYVDASNVSDGELEMGLIALTVADGVALTDAIDALEHIPGIDGAQPNYVYTIADESSSSASTGTSSSSSSSGTSNSVSSSSTSSSSSMSTSSNSPEPTSDSSNSALEADLSANASASEPETNEFIISIAAAINDAYALSQSNYWQLESVNAFDAWSQLGYSTASDANPIGIAIIDTGANTTHEDLKDRIVATYNSRNNSPDVSDSNGHGTHVAGIAAATANNGIGVAGVSYNSNLVIIEASTGEGTGSSGGSFSTTTIANAYTWLLSDPGHDGKTVAQENNVRVINMSIGHNADVNAWTSGNDIALLNSITTAKSKGILTVCAAGNSGDGVSVPYQDVPGDYYDALSVINLEHSSSSSANDAGGVYYVNRSSGSNYNTQARSSDGTYAKDISAPGTGILSTVRDSDSSYGTLSGTSMASPLVAGVAALVYAAGDQAGKNLSADDARGAIQNTAHDLGSTGWDVEYGYGEVDAGAAVESVLGPYVSGNTLVGTNETAGKEIYTVKNSGGSTWTWSSSNTDVATIDASTGKLTPHAAGTTSIFATDGSTTRSLAITVIDPSITCTEVTGYYSNVVCSDPNDKLSYVWGYDQAAYAITGNGTELTSWTYSIENWTSSQQSGTATMGTSSGILTTRNITSSKSITVVATCTSNPNIKVTRNIAIKPLPTMSGTSSIYSGLGATYSLSNTIDGDTWTWTVSGAGASIASQNASSCTLKTDENTDDTATLVAKIDHTEYIQSITISKPAITGDSSIAAESSAIYYLDSTNYSVVWKATINGENLDESIATIRTGPLSTTGYPAAEITAVGKTFSPIDLTATISDSLGNTINCDMSVYIISGDLSELNVDIAVDEQVYSGSAQTPTPVVTISGTDDSGNVWSDELVAWSIFTSKTADYRVTGYENNINAGTATIMIEGINSYTGSATGTFTIAKRNLSSVYPSGSVSTQTYTGSQIRPTAPGLYFTVPDFFIFSHNVSLSNTDYEVSYGTNTNAGTGTIVYTGKGNYTGTKTVTFTINRASIAVPSAKTGLIYTGRAQTGVASGNYYTLSGTVSATNAGSYTAYATPDSNHKWSDGTSSKPISWSIARRSLSNAAVSGSYTYTGSAIRPSVTVTASGASGSPTYSTAYSNNVNAGTGYVTVTGTGNYTGTKTTGFTINRRNIAEANISVNNQTYTGGALTPNPTVTWNGRTLSNGSDYRASYANNTNVGTATVTVTGTGNYTGSTSKTFEITAGGVPMYRLYNPNSGEHFYTANAGERDMLVGVGWRYEGVGWTAPSTSNTPVYRMYNANGGEHHYTMSAGERDMLVSVGWNYEGVGWYSDDQQRVALFRDYNPNAFANNHNYTTSSGEHEMLMSVGWRSEGYAWYGM